MNMPSYNNSNTKDNRMKLNDMAILACIKISAEVRKSTQLQRYCNCNHLTNKGSTEFTVEVGLGVHTGWAVEGAVGSPFKIDASYVSPNVKIADYLHNAASLYETSIIISDVVIASCSPEMAALCRVIDQVSMKSLRRPMRIHTIDLDTSQLVVCDDHLASKSKFKNLFRWRQHQDMQKAAKWQQDFKVWQQFDTDKDLLNIRARFTGEFYRRFFTAYRNYEAGEWMVARDLLFTCHFEPKFHTPPVNLAEEDWPPDGPTRALLYFMKDYNFESPPDWPGYHPLRRRAA